jgi:small-conductance mechanosensitive channel
MRARWVIGWFLVVLAVAGSVAVARAADQNTTGAADGAGKDAAGIALSDQMDDVLAKEAAQVKAEFKEKALRLFDRTPLGWDLGTIDYMYKWILGLPLRLPELMRQILAQSRVLGIVGSLVMLTFIVAVLYSLFGRARVMRRIESALQPFRGRIPERAYPFFLAGLRVVVAAAIPLLLLGAYSLINAMIAYQAPWFALTGKLLGLWALAALLIGLLRETLTGGLFRVTEAHGKPLFRLTRMVLLYMLFCVALFWSAQDFLFRKDVLAFLRFAITVSMVCLFLLLVLKKRAFLSLLPELPYRSYQNYVRLLARFYYPLIGLSFVLALLWCFGYRSFGSLVLAKIWYTAGALVLLTLIYHALRTSLQHWSARVPAADESAQHMLQSTRSFLVYATAVAAAALFLNMLGLIDAIQRLLSFPVVEVSGTVLTFWILIKAALIIFFFLYGSRLLQAFMDYKIYPILGIDAGTGFAINTILRLALLAFGVFFALNTLGIDLKFLLVFAGAIGIGIGLGLQNMAASLISGFTIIFGGKVRKGDWIEVEGTLGEVIDIHALSTRIRTRNNVEYLVPNSSLVSSTIINYSLSSPMVWVTLDVGVSYGSDPRQVEAILLEVARREPMVSREAPPRVLFSEFADSSLNFTLLTWVDVRRHAQRAVRSALYFAVFDAFKKAGIEIPFPQRDIHIRRTDGGSAPALPDR